MPTEASAAQQTQKSVIIDWFDEDDTVTVVPRDQRRFDVHKDRAIRLLQADHDKSALASQFDLLIRQAASWIKGHADKIHAVHLTVAEGGFSFVVVRKETSCDDELQDAVASFDFQIANDSDLDLIDVDAIALPLVSDDALSSFLDHKIAFQFYGERSRPHRVGK